MGNLPPSLAYRLGLAARRVAIAIAFGFILGLVTRRPWLGFLVAFVLLFVQNTYTAWLEIERNHAIETERLWKRNQRKK